MESIYDVVICNNQPLIAISTEEKKIHIFLVRKNDIFYYEPLCVVEDTDNVVSMDLVGSGLIFLSGKGITAMNVITRQKMAKKLWFKGETAYTAVRWAK